MRLIFALMVTLMLLPDNAGSSHGRDWSFRVLLDGREVGSHRFELSHDGEVTRLETEADIRVKFLFATVYRYKHRNVEIWDGNCLKQIDSNTRANRKEFFVEGERRDGAFLVQARDGSRELPECIMSFAYWNPTFLRESKLLNSQDGKYLPVQVEGPVESQQVAGGTQVPALRYRLTGEKLDISLWYTRDNEWIALESQTTSGHTLRYEML